MTFALIKNNIAKGILAIAAVAVLFTAAYTVAVKQTSYSNDKTNYRFISDIKTVYTADESKDLQITFVDTDTGEKPVGISVLMKVDDGPTQTVLSASSRTSSRFVNMGNLSQGLHQVTFTLPEACGNFFDYSRFDAQTKFDNQFDCQFVRQFSVGQNTGSVCTDGSALNTGDPLPCDYGPGVATCLDTSASNYGFRAPCIYDGINGCTNSAATNYNPSATNNDGSCIFPPLIDGCTDPSASNYNPNAQNDNGSCEYYIYGCTDPRANNYDPNATALDASCTYDGEVTPSDFECSANNQNWAACEGRTFTLTGPNDTIYVRTEAQNAGVWSDWCTGDLNNGVQATFDGLTSNDANAEVAFTFANPGSLFDMTLCLDPSNPTKAFSFQRIKLKLLDTKFIEN